MKTWTAVEWCVNSRPYEFTAEDKEWMRRLAERLVRPSKVSREDRRTIERVWLQPQLRVLGDDEEQAS